MLFSLNKCHPCIFPLEISSFLEVWLHAAKMLPLVWNNPCPFLFFLRSKLLTIYAYNDFLDYRGGLNLAGCQTPCLAALSLPLLDSMGRENKMKSLWIETKKQGDHRPVNIMGKRLRQNKFKPVKNRVGLYKADKTKIPFLYLSCLDFDFFPS